MQHRIKSKNMQNRLYPLSAKDLSVGEHIYSNTYAHSPHPYHMLAFSMLLTRAVVRTTQQKSLINLCESIDKERHRTPSDAIQYCLLNVERLICLFANKNPAKMEKKNDRWDVSRCRSFYRVKEHSAFCTWQSVL